ncbi:MAG: MazG nucleotide pyrophosphohydrolase domain-containing protein [Oceanococcus sp.]
MRWIEEKPDPARPLLEALRLQKQAAKLGFDWDGLAPLWDKLSEEVAEFKEAVAGERKLEIQDELGDLMFMLVNFSRFLEVSAGNALHGTNEKFCQRLSFVESQLEQAGMEWQDADIDQLEAWWQQAKLKRETS